MSEFQDKSGEPDKPQSNNEPITLTIRIMPDLSCQVQGPINDKILSYGMIESAKDVIREYHLRKEQSIVKPNGHGIINFARFKK